MSGDVHVRFCESGEVRLLPATHLVNLIVVEEGHEVPREELVRVLVPRGVACIEAAGRWTTFAKPWPGDIDEWTHYLHGPDNNAVSADTRVGPPRRLRWSASPKWARSHEHLAAVSAMVTSGGRVFYIIDEGEGSSVVFDPKRFLIARDAFNGILLWRGPVGRWEGHLRRFENRPPELPRRLVAVGDTVYVTLGYGESVTALDAATGRTIRTFEGSGDTVELLHANGLLVTVLGDIPADEAARAERTRGPTPSPVNRRLKVFDAARGRLMWEKSDSDTKEMYLGTVAVSTSAALFFQTPSHLVCLDAHTGKQKWRSDNLVSAAKWRHTAPALVAWKDVVICGQGGGKAAGRMAAFSAADGMRLWEDEYFSNVMSSGDVLIADGLVWSGHVARPADPGVTRGLDPRTGQVKRTRPADAEFFNVAKGHHYCYRNKGTARYLILGRGGTEFVDLKTGSIIPHKWVRGGCQYGVMPANGLLYALPSACTCYSEYKFSGFNAFASAVPELGAVATPLERGGAYGRAGDALAQPDSSGRDWPTYRGDNSRSGASRATVPPKLREIWKADVGGRLTQPVVAAGRAYVAAVDAHTLYALDTKTGERLWSRTVGGRIDSPPSVMRGLVAFGSADGWVYCVLAEDGQLVWRFRGAPRERKVCVRGRLESAWPVHGSVLAGDGTVTFAAGRSSYLDGGIWLHWLDLATGKVLASRRLDSRDPETGFQVTDARGGTTGYLSDVLSADGEHVFMRHGVFMKESLAPALANVPRVLAGQGFLDNVWMHRSYWVYGTASGGTWGGWARTAQGVAAGHILATDGETIYGYGRHAYSTSGSHIGLPPGHGSYYHLFAADRKPRRLETRVKKGKRTLKQRGIEYKWSSRTSAQARAMAVAGGDDLHRRAARPRLRHGHGRPVRQARLQGLARRAGGVSRRRQGAKLLAVDTTDGVTRGETLLPAPPVFDGIAVARAGLFVSLSDGSVRRFGE